MNKNRKLVTAFLVSTMLLASLAPAAIASEETNNNASRLGGSSRVETSVKVSNEVYDSANSVIVAGYRGEADALTGTLLASAKKAPLLLVSDKAEDISAVKAEIGRLGADNVFLLGGENAISNKIESALSEYSVERIKGNDRFDTAAAVARKVANGQNKKHIFLTNDGRSGSLADALAAGPVSGKHQMPVLLTSKGSIPQATLDALKDLGVEKITIVGGNVAVDEEVEAELNENYKVDRIKGSTRFETAESVAETYFADSEKVVLANDGRPNEIYTDALVGGYLGAAKNAPLLLTAPETLNHATVRMLKNNAASFAYVIGGTGVVSSNIQNIVSKILIPNSKPVITTKERVENVDVKYKTTKQNDPTLEVGKTIIQRSGRNGQIKKTYNQTYENGIFINEELMSEETVREVIDEIILVGTKVKPQGAPKLDMNTFNMSQFNTEFLSLINAERARIGVAPLTYNPELQKGTNIRASELQISYNRHHLRPNGELYFTAFEYLYDIPDYRIAENIAYYWVTEDVEEIVSAGETTYERYYANFFYEQYRNSSGHYRNMISRHGVGFSVSVHIEGATIYNAMILEHGEL